MKKVFFILAIIITITTVLAILLKEKNDIDQNSLPINNIVSSPTTLQTFAPVIIDSTPRGAYVFLDNEELGITPVTVTNLSNTIHQLRLRKEGFEELGATFSPSSITNLIHLSLVPLSNISPQSPSPTPIDNIPLPNPTDTTNIETIINELNNNDPQIPTELAGQVNVPSGYRFPFNADLANFITLEIIPPLLVQDSTTKRLPVVEKNELLAKLRFGYRYNPFTQNIEPVQLPLTSLIDFGYFEPATLSVPADSFVSWFNQSPTTCTLRTDPKSPQKINQTILSQKSTTIQLKEKGIYIFFCQGNPGPIQTISVS